MLDDLKTFFTLASNYRTSNIISQQIIMTEAMPRLASKTRSQRLKGAISQFIQENANVARPTQVRGR